MPLQRKPKRHRGREEDGTKAANDESFRLLAAAAHEATAGESSPQVALMTSLRPWTLVTPERRGSVTKVRPQTTGHDGRRGSLTNRKTDSVRMPSAKLTKGVNSGSSSPANASSNKRWKSANLNKPTYKHAEYFDISKIASETRGKEYANGQANSLISHVTRPRQSAMPRLLPPTTSGSSRGYGGTSWALTQLPEIQGVHPQPTVQELPTPPGEEEEQPAEVVLTSSSEEEEEEKEEGEDTERDRRRGRRIANRRRSLLSWTDGPDVNSDDYDTDLEEDFPPEEEPNVEATGACFYEDRCRKKGTVPVSYLLRNMGEGNLRMRHHYLGGTGTKPLAEALKRNTVCEEIDLSDNYIEGQGAAALANTLRDNMFIVNLNVSNNFIRAEGAEALAEMLEANTTLKTLSLQGNQLSDQAAKRIAEALKNNMSLSCLDLSHNDFSEIGGLFLAQGIAANIGLADLDLSWNSIREKGAVAIAKAVAKNATLEILDLSWNGLSYTGTLALANALKLNGTLKVLDISNNRLNPEGAKYLGRCLTKNQGLETLLMSLNPIGTEGVESILKAAGVHARLKLLGIENTVDLSMFPNLLDLVKHIQESRDLMVMATVGPQPQSRINSTVLAVFDRFLTENSDRMEDLFNQMDKDRSGDVTLEELKYGLKDFGLRLTSKQLDMLLEELDADKSGTIEYTELMQGSALIKREKQKMERAAAEALRYSAVGTKSPSSGSPSRSRHDLTVQ